MHAPVLFPRAYTLIVKVTDARQERLIILDVEPRRVRQLARLTGKATDEVDIIA
jgi:hypothetical protein